MKYVIILLVLAALASCTVRNYWDLKCNGYIGTYKKLSGPRYIVLDKPFIAYSLGGGDSLFFSVGGNGIEQGFHSWDTVGFYKRSHVTLKDYCGCK